MARSDLTGEAIPAEDAQTAEVRIGDKTRTVTLSREQAELVVERGRPPDTTARALAFIRTWLPRVLGGFLVLLLIPAITAQWTDSAKQVDVKRGLLSRMAADASAAIGTSRVVGLDLLPATQLAQRKRAQGTATAKTDLDEARAEATAGNNAILAWEKASATIGAELAAYFPDSSLPDGWRDYTQAVRNYQRIESSICGSARVDLIVAVRRYLERTEFSPAELDRLRAFAVKVARASSATPAGAKPPTAPTPAQYKAMYTRQELHGLNELQGARYFVNSQVSNSAQQARWKALIVENGPGCQAKGFAFKASYAYLGDQLLEHEDTVLRRVADTDLAGFSTGPDGLLRRLTFGD